MNFNVGLSGIGAAQTALKVTQQNIANIGTKGYTRQEVVLKEIGVASGEGVLKKVGTGVRATDIRLVKDDVLLGNFFKQTSETNYYKEIESVLAETETVLGEYTEGNLANLMQGFFQAWEELSKFPEEIAYKFSVLGEADKLVSKINEMGSELSRLESDAKLRTDTYLTRLNTISEKIANVNYKINNSGMNPPNALINERNQLLEELSEFVEVDVSYESTNPEIATVRTGGVFLVSGVDAYPLKVVETTEGSFLVNGSTRVEPKSGKLQASIRITDDYLAEYRGTLEAFVGQLANRINDVHSSGFSANGATGYPFFTGTGTKTLAVNAELLKNPSRLATSVDASVEGNTDISSAIARIIKEPYANGTNFLDYLNTFGMKMAQDLNLVQAQVTVQNGVLTGILAQKEGVQGVNLEEEMANLLMYQNMYTANAKTISILKTLDDTVLNMI